MMMQHCLAFLGLIVAIAAVGLALVALPLVIVPSMIDVACKG
jgi:hypothetical protein